MPKKKNAVRPDGLIAVQIYIGRVDGKRKYKTVYGRSQREADEKAAEVRAMLKKGIDITTARDSFSEWSKKWLKAKEADVSHVYYSGMCGKVDRINDWIGDIEIAKVRTSDMQEFIDSMAKSNEHTGKPTAKKTLADYKGICEQVFEMAIENRVLDYNPAKYIRIPQKAPKEHRRALTDEEQGWIINTPHRAQRAAMIMMYAGLRRGELIPLQWRDIDLINGTISITKSVEIISGKASVKSGGKTDSSIRVVDIPSILRNFLETEYAKSKATPFQIVCAGSNGGMMTESAFRRMWESYIRDLNFKYGNRMDKKGNIAKSKYNKNGLEITIPRFTPHWLRHTFATMLYLADVDVLTAKEQLGHSDIKTTLSIYTHLDQTYKRKSMKKLDDYLTGKSSMQVNMQVKDV